MPVSEFGIRGSDFRRRRRGVSILEVLFAILIAAVGLLGAIAVLPLASSQSQRGRQHDALAVAGLSAAHDFDIRGMRYPNRCWMYWNQANNRFEPAGGAISPGQSYCFDPRFMAANGTAANGPAASSFPYIPFATAPGPRMGRLTFYSGVNNSSGYPLAMGQLQADSLFVFGDDLTYERPSDRSRKAWQKIDSLPADALMANEHARRPGKRQTTGYMSWMATLVPRIDRYYMDTANPNASGYSDMYVLSVVIFQQRSAALAMDGQSERVVSILAMPGAGITGGEVALTADNQAALKLRPDDWILLGGASNFGARSDFDFKWYRVSDCDPELDTGGLGYIRYATLVGRDWNPAYVNVAASAPYNNFPQATIVEGVFGVYEKTIHLDFSAN